MRLKGIYDLNHIGRRPIQEDQCCLSLERSLVAVADGFGGIDIGVKASQLACESVLRFLEKEAGDEEATFPYVLKSYYSMAGNVLFNAFIYANRLILTQNQGKSIHEKAGASLVAAFLDGSNLVLANAGSSEAWILRQGKQSPLLLPQSYARMINPFLIEVDEMKMGSSEGSLEESIPLNPLGLGEDLEPEVMEVRVKAGDWVCLQTDGFSPELRARLARLQLQGMSLEAAIEELKKAIDQSPSWDNLRVAVLEF